MYVMHSENDVSLFIVINAILFPIYFAKFFSTTIYYGTTCRGIADNRVLRSVAR